MKAIPISRNQEFNIMRIPAPQAPGKENVARRIAKGAKSLLTMYFVPNKLYFSGSGDVMSGDSRAVIINLERGVSPIFSIVTKVKDSNQPIETHQWRTSSSDKVLGMFTES